MNIEIFSLHYKMWLPIWLLYFFKSLQIDL